MRFFRYLPPLEYSALTENPAQLRRIGIRGTLKTHESAAGYAAFGKGDFTLITAQDRAMDGTDPSDPFSLIWTTQGGSNYGKWSDPKFDELAERGLKATSKAERAKLYHEAQRHFLNGAPSAIPVGSVEGWFFTDKNAAQLQAIAVRVRQHHLHEGVASEVIRSRLVRPRPHRSQRPTRLGK